MSTKNQKNSEYWAERFKLLEESTFEHSEEWVKESSKQFKKSLSTINNYLSRFYHQFEELTGLNYADAKRALDKKSLKEFKMTVNEYIELGRSLNRYFDPDVLKQLEKASLRVRISRDEAIKYYIQAETAKLFAEMNSSGLEHLAQAYENRYYQTAYELREFGTSFARLNKNQIQKALAQPWRDVTFSETIWQNQAKLQKNLTDVVTQATILGKSYTEASKTLEEKMKTGSNNCSRIISTEMAAVSSQAQAQMYNELGVEKYIIYATFDKKTCPVCQSMDGKIFEKKNAVVGDTMAPFHPRCRCTTAPYFDDMKPKSRIARNKEGKSVYIDNMSYRDWAKEFGIEPVYGLWEPPEAPEEKQIPVKFGEKLKREYPDWVFDGVTPKLENAPDNCKKAWNACAEKNLLHCGRKKAKDDDICYIPPKRKGTTGAVHINIYKDKEGNEYKAPWHQFFHEHGHNVDFILNQQVGTGKGNESISTTYKNGAFRKALKQDFENGLNAFIEANKKDPSFGECETKLDWLFEYVSSVGDEYFRDKQAGFSLSDMFAGQVDAYYLDDILKMGPIYSIDWSHPFSGGHKMGYYKDSPTNIECEAFAEMFEGAVNCPESLEAIKKYFPTAYDVFNEILDLVE